MLTFCRHQQAIDLLLEVIRSVPNLADPYTTLGTLHETVGKHKEALNFYMIAAHMTGNVSVKTTQNAAAHCMRCPHIHGVRLCEQSSCPSILLQSSFAIESDVTAVPRVPSGSLVYVHHQ